MLAFSKRGNQMRKKERINIVEYLYHMEARLEEAVRDCAYRYIRREIDEVELLEEMIAKIRLKAFQEFSNDILRILELTEEEDT